MAENDAVYGSEELWSCLEVAEGEGLRILEHGPRLLLLERVGSPSHRLPVSGAPTLSAEVANFPLPQLFEWIEATQRTGFLYFTCRDQAKSIYLHRGEVVFASSNQLVDRLGESLLRAGAIQLEQLREAQRCYSPNARLGKVLVERGFLTPRELWNGVKYQVEEIVRSLFAYTNGRAYFWEGDSQPDNVVRLSLPTRRLVAEGIQRRDELRKFLAVLEDSRVQLAAVRSVDAELSGQESELVEAIPGEPRFPNLCEALGLDRESAARSLQLLRLVGAVKLMRARDEAAVGPTDIEGEECEELRQLVSIGVKAVAGLVEPIATADGNGGIQSRLASALEDAASRFPVLLNGVSLGSRASLDPELLIDRALRLDGDREQQVVAAIGELISYLEFEIMNHPAIDDAESVLARVSDLRTHLGV